MQTGVPGSTIFTPPLIQSVVLLKPYESAYQDGWAVLGTQVPGPLFYVQPHRLGWCRIRRIPYQQPGALGNKPSTKPVTHHGHSLFKPELSKLLDRLISGVNYIR